MNAGAQSTCGPVATGEATETIATATDTLPGAVKDKSVILVTLQQVHVEREFRQPARRCHLVRGVLPIHADIHLQVKILFSIILRHAYKGKSSNMELSQQFER